MKQHFSALALALSIACVAQPSLAGDVAKGEKVFKKCAACHMVGEGAQNRVGPKLNGIVGGKVASVGDFTYSKGMTEYGASNPVWTEEALTAYLENPRGIVKGTRMSFAGLRKASDRDDVIAYLKTFK